MCGVYTLSMPVFDSTSIELPRALSGSKELMGRVRSTVTAAVCAKAAATLRTQTTRRLIGRNYIARVVRWFVDDETVIGASCRRVLGNAHCDCLGPLRDAVIYGDAD